MKKILIGTAPGDGDAIAIQLALKKHGIEAYRWLTSEFGSRQQLVCHIHPKAYPQILLADYGQKLDFSSFDVFWNRRMREAVAGLPDGEPEYTHAKKERKALLEGVFHFLDGQMRCINPFGSISKANAKFLQLALAARLELDVAETVMTNQLSAAKEFVEAHENIIYKTFTPLVWREGGNTFALYTSMVDRQQLSDETDLSVMPHIFQRSIIKQYEIRSVFMGGDVSSVSIASKDGGSMQDWRMLKSEEMTVVSINLPNSVKAKCIDLMKSLGIEFGCFDFIVDEKGTYYFLEVNQAGQFLFLEAHCPETRMLDRFCQFLLHDGDPFSFRFDVMAPKFSRSDLDQRVGEIQQEELATCETRVQI